MLALICTLYIASSAQSILVMPLRAEVVEDSSVNVMDEVLLNEVSRAEGFSLIAFSELAELIKAEEAKDILECNDVSCAAEIGGAMSADFTLIGIVGRLQNTLVIRLTLFNNKNMTVKRASIYVKNGESIIDAFAEIVSDILGVQEQKKEVAKKTIKMGTLRIISNVQIISVFVDGKRRMHNRRPEQNLSFQVSKQRGYSSFLDVHTGNRKIRVTATGFTTYETETKIKAGELTELNVHLVRLPETKTEIKRQNMYTVSYILFGIGTASIAAGIALRMLGVYNKLVLSTMSGGLVVDICALGFGIYASGINKPYHSDKNQLWDQLGDQLRIGDENIFSVMIRF